MTVAELIHELKKADPKLKVMAWDGDYQRPIPVIEVHVQDGTIWLETRA